ncbi:ring-cleaving dioxygenase [Halapricum salinum]|uniref:Ring-cleaving dioxygenase n=1 Tax=Halapricum salinum TaxID=1457250 RepID=A0A4D6HA26_9EURY|nr:ring-cleaving dioxygenase [Halapricum salinum]QCC50823.1 ring-cleaving dioxygenase [Halapricum salinum]
MSPTTSGLHHVTAIAGDPQRNADFYVETLGLRLVKRTVNHDDTGTYHLYFGDGVGTPGTNITFFPWGETGRQGEFGAGQTAATAYRIRPESLVYWRDRLDERGVDVEETTRFDEPVLAFADTDGIGLELIASESALDADTVAWEDSPVPAEHQLRGFHSVTLAVETFEPTHEILTEVLGYGLDAEAGDRRRYRTPAGSQPLDLVETNQPRGRMGVGTVHHVAFEAPDTDAEAEWRGDFADHDLRSSRVIDRTYFQSVYCREPGGILFELATPDPGFTADEDVAELGSRLVLPDWLEDERGEIEAQLPPFDPPRGTERS